MDSEGNRVSTPSNRSVDRQRILDIPGCHNLRDLGGYCTADGRRVKWGMLYRSGVMNAVPDTAIAALHRLGVRSIVDLRDTSERARRPTDWHEGTQAAYYSRDYAMSVGDLPAILGQSEIDDLEVVALLSQVYRELPFEQIEAMRHMFARIVEGAVPLLFHCAAGKDRTGVAAALILRALRVDEDHIFGDYALSDSAMPRLAAMMNADSKVGPLSRFRESTTKLLLQSDPANLGIAFAEIERRCGGVDDYLRTELGVGEAERARLAELLLEADPDDLPAR